MTKREMFEKMRRAIEGSPRNAYLAEMHVQVLKYAEELDDVTGREFCEAIGVSAAFGTEFSKMKKIAERLRDAGLDPRKI
jgi:hypothetical protein